MKAVSILLALAAAGVLLCAFALPPRKARISVLRRAYEGLGDDDY